MKGFNRKGYISDPSNQANFPHYLKMIYARPTNRARGYIAFLHLHTRILTNRAKRPFKKHYHFWICISIESFLRMGGKFDTLLFVLRTKGEYFWIDSSDKKKLIWSLLIHSHTIPSHIIHVVYQVSIHFTLNIFTHI